MIFKVCLTISERYALTLKGKRVKGLNSKLYPYSPLSLFYDFRILLYKNNIFEHQNF